MRSGSAKSTIDANTGAMRRFAFAAISLSLYSATAFPQSQIQHLPRETAETATAQAPMPSPDDANHPATPNPAGPVQVEPKQADPVWPIRNAASDVGQLPSHLRIGAAADYGTFSGYFLSQSPIGSNLGGAWFFSLDAGYGVSRHLELVLVGDFAVSSAGSECNDCSASSWAIGPMLRYHIVEGTRFSPWLAIGAAYRQNSWSGVKYTDVKKSTALEFLRVSVGGDWYATSKVAFGPTCTVGLGMDPLAPTGNDGKVFALVHAGLRLTLDFPGR